MICFVFWEKLLKLGQVTGIGEGRKVEGGKGSGCFLELVELSE
jgi:hypothetical protein